MKSFNIEVTLQEGYILLETTKGHIKKRVLDAVVMLEEIQVISLLETIIVRENVKSLINCGDVNEVLCGQKLGFIDKNAVSINCDDLPRKGKMKLNFVTIKMLQAITLRIRVSIWDISSTAFIM